MAKYLVTFRPDFAVGITRSVVLALLQHAKTGFWVDSEYKYAPVGKEAYFILPHMITSVKKVLP